MKLTGVFDVAAVTRTNGPPVSIYPGGPVTPGVGLEVTGQYQTPPESEVQGYFIYNQTISHLDSAGHSHCLGLIDLRVTDTAGNRIQVAASFTLELANPVMPFSVIKVDALIIGATINGRVSTGQIKITPIDGGRRYSGAISLHKLC